MSHEFLGKTFQTDPPQAKNNDWSHRKRHLLKWRLKLLFLLYITIWTLKAFICPKAKIIILSLPKSCFLLFSRFSIFLSPWILDPKYIPNLVNGVQSLRKEINTLGQKREQMKTIVMQDALEIANIKENTCARETLVWKNLCARKRAWNLPWTSKC